MSEFLSIPAQPKGSHYINGQYIDDTRGRSFHCLFPATGETVASLHYASDEIISMAIESAQYGQAKWASYSAQQRSEVLYHAAQLIRQHNEILSQLETLDTGKPIRETRVADAASAQECVEYFAALSRNLHGQYINFGADYGYTVREPLGVCLGIGAWNYPIQIAGWKSAPALACGNSMIFKPSEVTPLTALKLAEIYTQAGLPDGVFNVIQGDGEIANKLLKDKRISKVSITGSTKTGQAVMRQAADNITKVSLELGGKSPLIIFDDADIQRAVDATMDANFYSTGQICSNGTRVYVHENIYEPFMRCLLASVKQLKIGDPRDAETIMGPLVSEPQLKRVDAYIKKGLAEGATLYYGGELIEMGNGYYIQPTIFTDVQEHMCIAKEEIFGPVACVFTFNNENDVIERANRTDYGLSAGVISKDIIKAKRVVSQIKAGSCWINSYNLTPVELPFGGFKMSGIGRENGLAAIEQYSQIKSVYVASE